MRTHRPNPAAKSCFPPWISAGVPATWIDNPLPPPEQFFATALQLKEGTNLMKTRHNGAWALGAATWLLACVLAIPAAAAAPAGVDLNNLSGWDIVVDPAAIPSELYAAEELQHHVHLATGVQLPIVKQVDRPDRHIFVGAGAALRDSAVGFSVEQAGPEDLRIVVRDQNIAIAGGRPRGTLYGVYTFLEDYLGVRFLTHDHTHVPKVDKPHVVGPVDRDFHPVLGFRWSYYGENAAQPAFAARLRVNTITGDEKLGGKTGRVLIGHSFGSQIPSAKYGKEHPEYYCEIDGQRRAAVQDDYRDNEPCLTNPAVLEIVTASVLADLRANPKAENISVSQNDNDKYCRCAKCSAIDTREGTPMGSLLTFVNGVAERVANEFPNVKIGTLSYWYSRRPPQTIRPRPNVQIQLCSIECCLIHPINDPNCPRNVQFCEDMKRWGTLSDDIAIWNYNTNFSNYLLPCPNLRVIEPNVRYFVANQAKGIFMQAAGNATGAELSDLRNYVMSGLLWDSTRSGQGLVDEFLDLHYAEAAAPIRRFIQLVHDRAEASGLHKNCFGKAADYGIDESVAQSGLDAFAEAMKLAKTDAVRQRVEKASVCAYRAAIEPCWNWDGMTPLEPELKERMRPLVRQFFALCQKHGVSNVGEQRTVLEMQKRLKQRFGLPESEEF